MDFLELTGKTVVVLGVANRKSVAFHVSERLRAVGARVVHVVQNEAVRERVTKLLGAENLLVCDVERPAEMEALAAVLRERYAPVHGLVHSIAFANYSEGPKPFHETGKADFLQAVDVSCYSLIALARQLKPSLAADASVVTISISSTRMAAENYGYMAPIKAALDSAVVFLAKSFSAGSAVRFNAVGASLLKTSASAGIPGYLESYLFAEQATLRHKALETGEVADVVLFLLSPRSSGINAQKIVVDAGMGVNYFDRELVRRGTETPR